MSNDRFGKLGVREFDEVCSRCTPTESMVYAALVTLRNSSRLATPPIGISLIEAKTSLPRRTAFRCVAGLIEKGCLTKERTGQRSVYRFPLAESATGGTDSCHR